MARLNWEFYDRDTLAVARDLVGCFLVRELDGTVMACRITETEAYIGAVDNACHAYGGRRTARTETLYAAPGTSYVYFIYGMYHCLNFVTEAEGVAAAVLIRGGQPVVGTEEISRLRFGVKHDSLTAYQRKNFLNGPGKLCRGLAIDRSLNALPWSNGQLYVCDSLPEYGLQDTRRDLNILTGKRIGIDYAQEAVDFPWRFYISEK